MTLQFRCCKPGHPESLGPGWNGIIRKITEESVQSACSVSKKRISSRDNEKTIPWSYEGSFAQIVRLIAEEGLGYERSGFCSHMVLYELVGEVELSKVADLSASR